MPVRNNAVVTQTWIMSTLILMLIGMVAWQTSRIIDNQDVLIEAKIVHDQQILSLERRLTVVESYDLFNKR